MLKRVTVLEQQIRDNEKLISELFFELQMLSITISTGYPNTYQHLDLIREMIDNYHHGDKVQCEKLRHLWNVVEHRAEIHLILGLFEMIMRIVRRHRDLKDAKIRLAWKLLTIRD